MNRTFLRPSRFAAILGASIAATSLFACAHLKRGSAPEASTSARTAHPAQDSQSTSGSGPWLQEPSRAPAASQNQESDPIRILKNWLVTPHPEHGFITRLEEIEKLNLLQGEAANKPWSGSFWPDKIGGVAARYRQINMAPSMVRKMEQNYVTWRKKHWRTVDNFSNLTEQEIALLSPAEKYDLLMGDRDFTFTTQVWDGIFLQARLFGRIANWSGICNGWTASSVELARPRRAVRATAPSGQVVTFYPDDIKALASVLWAHDFVNFRNAEEKDNPSKPVTWTKMGDGTPAGVNYGLRCNLPKPRRIKGAVIDLEESVATVSKEECRDLNPAIWHLAIVNRTGLQKQSFVMDKDYNWSVNNHTVYGYDFDYFNVASGFSSRNFRDAVMPIDMMPSDAFRSYRSSQTRYLVGVEMRVKYVDYLFGGKMGETFDHEDHDRQSVMTVKYDLELDRNYRPISGQWRVNRLQKPRPVLGYEKPNYPDFIWYQRQWTYSYYEQFNDPYLDQHDWSKPIPEILRERAKQSAKVVWFPTVRDRAEAMPVSPELKERARKASDDYDAACAKYCEIAYPKDSNGIFLPDSSPAYRAPEAIQARKAMEPFDQALTQASKDLELIGVPKTRPYVQPLARVIYGLIEAAKEPEITPAPRPDNRLLRF